MKTTLQGQAALLHELGREYMSNQAVAWAELPVLNCPMYGRTYKRRSQSLPQKPRERQQLNSPSKTARIGKNPLQLKTGSEERKIRGALYSC